MKLYSAAVIAIASLALGQTAKAQLVTNGNFSANASSYTTSPGYSGGTNPANPTGWEQVGNPTMQGVNGVGISNPFGPSNQTTDDAGHSISDYQFLQDAGTYNRQGINFAANTQYTLTFDAASRVNYPLANLAVIINDGSGSNNADPIANIYDGRTNGGITAGNDQFHLESITFTTGNTIGQGSVIFYNNSGGGDITSDITNVSIIPTPEPTSIVLLGLGALGMLARRRRRAV